MKSFRKRYLMPSLLLIAFVLTLYLAVQMMGSIIGNFSNENVQFSIMDNFTLTQNSTIICHNINLTNYCTEMKR